MSVAEKREDIVEGQIELSEILIRQQRPNLTWSLV